MKLKIRFIAYLAIVIVLVAVSFLYSALDVNETMPSQKNQLHQLSEKGKIEITD